MNKNNMEKSIPVIDLEKICEEGECKKLREACEKWGCFRIINHTVPATLMAQMKEVVGVLLELPMEIKMRNTAVIAGSGYMAPSSINPLYEALSLFDLDSPQAMKNFCSQLDVSPYQREIMEAYGEAIHGLAVYIGQKMGESVGVAVGAEFEDWTCQFRINKYSFTPESVGSSGVQLHTDSGFLTILQDDENIGGLEVMDTSGSFVPVPPLPGTLLVNLGDIGHAWSNGRFYHVKHRVICKEAKKRLSIATFMLGPKNRIIEAPAELVDHDHPRLYQPFIYEDYRKVRISNKMHTGALELFRLVQS